MLKTAFAGLGDQGGPMAERIAAAGLPLAVWARRSDAAKPFGALGAEIAESPRALAETADLLCLCVTGGADVAELLFDRGMMAGLRPGSILAIHSTIAPDGFRRIEAAAAERGVAVLDAPVSGSGRRARDGTLLLMAGGEASVLERARPVFRAHSGTILHLGAVGAAMRAKLVNNLMALSHIGLAIRALEMGAAAGIDPWALRDTVLAGTGASFGMDVVRRLHEPQRARHILSILEKDAALALDCLHEPHIAEWRALAAGGLERIAALAHAATALQPPPEEFPHE